MNPYTKLARKTIGHWVKNRKKISLPGNLASELLKKKAGVFVSIHRLDGSLRGCIGTFLPTQKNIAEEIVNNATAAAQDPRFPPVAKEELPDLVYKVDILSELKPAQKEGLNPQKYGLLVSAKDGRRGLLLPDIKGIETPEQQITFCRKKAGILPEEKVKFQTFTVRRYSES